MLGNVVVFLVQTVLGLLTFLLLLRFLMQWTRTPFQNPLGQMCMALTDFMVKPVRKVIKHYKQWDLSTLTLALLMQILLATVLSLLGGMVAVSPLAVLVSAVLGVVTTLVDIFFYAILLMAIMSWVNPHTPMYGVLNQLTAPILRPLRNLLPPIQGFDLSALAALILLQMLGHIILPGLAGALM